MYRYARDVSPLAALEDLQSLLSLEIPASFIQEESIRESDDGLMATYRLVWYDHANNDPDGDRLDARPIVDEAAQDFLGNQLEADFDTHHETYGRNRNETTVSVHVPKAVTEAATRRNASEQPVPLTLYAGQDVFNIATDGAGFLVLRNGSPVEVDLPSLPFALGRLAFHALTKLADIEAESGIAAGHPNDFLAGVAQALIDAPDVTDEALEHFVTFYEMVTLQDFGAVQGAFPDDSA